MSLVKGNNVIGHEVITLKDGKKVDKVKDIVYDPREHKVKALLLDEGGWFSDAKIILTQDIKNIGKDAIIIESEDRIKKASEVTSRVACIAKENNYLTKTRIITETGIDLGKVSDIYFDPKTGKVDEIEVSQGLKNIQSGKKTFKVRNIVTVGEDATIVKKATEQGIEEQAKQKGIRGAINQMANKIQEKSPQVIEQIKTKTHEITSKAQEKARGIKEHPKTQEIAENVKQKTSDIKGGLKENLEKAKKGIRQGANQAKDKAQEAKNKPKENQPPHQEEPRRPIQIYAQKVEFRTKGGTKTKNNSHSSRTRRQLT